RITVPIDLADKVVLVTGGSRGIGACTVRMLARSNARVILHYGHGRTEAEAIARELGEKRCAVIGADLAVADAGFELWNKALAWTGHIDVLVNNAAVVTPMTIDDDLEQWRSVWEQTIAVNLRAMTDLCRAAIGHFRSRGGGSIINVASRAAFRGDDPH